MASLRSPLARAYPITTRFGAPNAITRAPHTGVDFGAPFGTPVLAAAAGVARRWWNAGGGNMVGIDHGDGTETRYAHLALALVGGGVRVAAGQQIGTVGATGLLVTGAHLHFEVLVGGQYVDPERALSGGTSPSSSAAAGPISAPASTSAAGQSAWVAKLTDRFKPYRGQTWGAVLASWETTKAFQLPGFERPEYMNLGFTEESWQELKGVVGALGLTSKPIDPADYPSIASRMTVGAAAPFPINIAIVWPNLWEPIANVVVVGAGVGLIYRGVMTILRP